MLDRMKGPVLKNRDELAIIDLAKRGAKSPFKGYAPMGLPPYPAVVCASVNDVIVHGIPNRAKLQDGDIIGLDFGAILEGFVGDGAITVPVETDDVSVL